MIPNGNRDGRIAILEILLDLMNEVQLPTYDGNLEAAKDRCVNRAIERMEQRESHRPSVFDFMDTSYSHYDRNGYWSLR